jgi:hypothetical protein
MLLSHLPSAFRGFQHRKHLRLRSHRLVLDLGLPLIRLLQEGLQISLGRMSTGGNDMTGSPIDYKGDPFATPSKTANQTAHASGTATPLTTEHNRAKYEAYRVLIETGTTSLRPAAEDGKEAGETSEESVEDETTDVGKLRKALKAVLHDAEDLVSGYRRSIRRAKLIHKRGVNHFFAVSSKSRSQNIAIGPGNQAQDYHVELTTGRDELGAT